MPTTYRVKVKAEQKREEVTAGKDGRLFVSVNAKREEGRANERCLVLLAQFLGVSEGDISIVRGHTQSTKTIVVRD